MSVAGPGRRDAMRFMFAYALCPLCVLCDPRLLDFFYKWLGTR
jgi:hypothetical protein